MLVLGGRVRVSFFVHLGLGLGVGIGLGFGLGPGYPRIPNFSKANLQHTLLQVWLRNMIPIPFYCSRPGSRNFSNTGPGTRVKFCWAGLDQRHQPQPWANIEHMQKWWLLISIHLIL